MNNITKQTRATVDRIKRMYAKWPMLIGNDDWTYAIIIGEDGFHTLEDISRWRVTRFKTVDRACRLARAELGITRQEYKKRAIQCKAYFATNK